MHSRTLPTLHRRYSQWLTHHPQRRRNSVKWSTKSSSRKP
jgi:hypothetical protein